MQLMNDKKSLNRLKITDDEYTKRAKELNEKERNDSEQEKKNIQWMQDSEQISEEN